MKRIIEALVQANQELFVVLTEEAVQFDEFGRRWDGSRHLTQTELRPFLQGIARIAMALAVFLEALHCWLDNAAARDAVRKTPPERRGLRVLNARLVLSFYQTAGGLALRFQVNKPGSSELWDQVYDLVLWFAYLGCGLSVSSSLISALGFLTGIFEKQPSDFWWEVYFKQAPEILLPELIKGLRMVAVRARFLETASEEERRAAAASWWCARVDSVPKGKEAHDLLRALLGHCPSPIHAEVQERLIQIAEHPDLDREVRSLARQQLQWKSFS